MIQNTPRGRKKPRSNHNDRPSAFAPLGRADALQLQPPLETAGDARDHVLHDRPRGTGKRPRLPVAAIDSLSVRRQRQYRFAFHGVQPSFDQAALRRFSTLQMDTGQ